MIDAGPRCALARFEDSIPFTMPNPAGETTFDYAKATGENRSSEPLRNPGRILLQFLRAP